MLNDDRLVAWFTNQLVYTLHPKLISIPLGAHTSWNHKDVVPGYAAAVEEGTFTPTDISFSRPPTGPGPPQNTNDPTVAKRPFRVCLQSKLAAVREHRTRIRGLERHCALALPALHSGICTHRGPNLPDVGGSLGGWMADGG